MMSGNTKKMALIFTLLLANVLAVYWLKGIPAAVFDMPLPLDILLLLCINLVLLHFIMQMQNVDEQFKVTLQNLHASDEKYRSLYYNAEIGLITTRFDGSEIIMVNPKTAHMLGYDEPGQLEGRASAEVWADAADRKTFLDLLKKNNSLSSYYARLVCKDKSIRHFEVSARYDPETDYIESNIVDVEDRVLCDNKLRYQADLLTNLQESIIVLDSDGYIIFINQRAQDIFGLLSDELNSHNFFRKIFPLHNTDLLEMHRQIQTQVLSGERWEGEFKVKINGEEKTFMHKINSLKENDLVKAVMIVSTDISELVKAREKAESANMAKNQFLANMSHEIRTPMIGILGAVDLLEQSSLTKEQTANVAIIRDCGEQLLRIINEILDVSKIEVGLVALEPEICNLTDILNKSTSIVEPLLHAKGLQLNLSIDLKIPERIVLDAIKIRQIILNLLYNAIKFTPQGSIHLTAEIDPANPAQLIISVSDTGIGIPQSQVNKIFEPFTQVDSSTSRQFGGNGLGLYLCKKLVELMQGKIWFESMEGRGTTFAFTVPLENVAGNKLQLEDNSSQDEETLAGSSLLEFNPVKILVVEDNPLNQKIVGQMLRNYGFDVILASNGLECLKILHEYKINLILMDMQMPVMDGYEATRFIRDDKSWQDLPIIAMTAHAMSGDREKCLACGCSAYIAKPFKAEELVKLIRKHLTSKTLTHHEINQFDHLLSELIPEFMVILSEMMEDLDIAVNSKNTEMIASISHDIKGTAGMYGFAEISAAAASIQEAARDSNYPQVLSLSSNLYSLVQQANTQVS